MAQASAGTVQGKAQPERTSRGRWLPGVSGNPSGNVTTKASKRYRELFDAMAAELGDLTAVDRALLEQACSLMVKSERVKDADAAVRLANASARLLMNLRKTRARREPARVPFRERLAAEFSGD